MLEKLNMGVPAPLGFTVISLLAMLVGGLTVSEYLSIKKEKIFTAEIDFLQAKIQEKKAGWKTYRNEILKFQIRYPQETISLSEKQNKIILSHSVVFEHDDPCDFKGEGLKLKELVDFNVSFELLNRGFDMAVKETQGEDFFADYFSRNKLKTEPGFIDEIKIGNLSGYVVTQGTEGCGQYLYYFPLNSENTLVIWRAFIPELQPAVASYQDNLNLPGIIFPEKEKILFEQIFSTFKPID